MVKKNLKLAVLFLVVGLLACKEALPPNPTSEYKRLLVRTLVKNYEIGDSGFYVFYWDGKDDSGKYVQPGLYRVVLNGSSKLQYYFNVEEGGEPGKNDRSRSELKEVPRTEIVAVSPNPFQVMSGTNIEVNFFSNGLLTLEIFFDKEPDG